jgi:hypothetical protein
MQRVWLVRIEVLTWVSTMIIELIYLAIVLHMHEQQNNTLFIKQNKRILMLQVPILASHAELHLHPSSMEELHLGVKTTCHFTSKKK